MTNLKQQNEPEKKFNISYYMAAVFLVGVVTLVYLSLGQSEKTVPKIKLSYFKSDTEVAESVHRILQQEIKTEKYFWFGIEPEAQHELEIYSDLKKIIENENGKFDIIYLDQELKLNEKQKELFGGALIKEIKEDWSGIAKEINDKNKKILIITASIYSTNFVKENPVHKINIASGLVPMTFSMGFFPTVIDEEKKNVFPCVTDDKEGVAAWGCLVLNKARSQRRKVDIKKISGENPLLVGVMDLTGEKDYMILIR